MLKKIVRKELKKRSIGMKIGGTLVETAITNCVPKGFTLSLKNRQMQTIIYIGCVLPESLALQDSSAE